MIYLDIFNTLLICALEGDENNSNCTCTFFVLAHVAWAFFIFLFFCARDENNNQSNMAPNIGSGGHFTNLLETLLI